MGGGVEGELAATFAALMLMEKAEAHKWSEADLEADGGG